MVSLVEVKNSERILSCRSLLKEDVNFWMEDLSPDVSHPSMEEFAKFVENYDSDIYEATLTNDSEEVATTIAGYIGKKLGKRSKCELCKNTLVSPI